ncbi:MAG: VOC family protein [Thermoanaerobaculia bacterium]
MARVTRIGGVFFKARDPEALRDWYARHLEIDIQPWGGAVFERNCDPTNADGGHTVWSIAPEDPEHTQPFVINYCVANLDAVLVALRAEGCQVDPKSEVSELGAFGWVTDPEGNRVELWQPPVARARV